MKIDMIPERDSEAGLSVILFAVRIHNCTGGAPGVPVEYFQALFVYGNLPHGVVSYHEAISA